MLLLQPNMLDFSLWNHLEVFPPARIWISFSANAVPCEPGPFQSAWFLFDYAGNTLLSLSVAPEPPLPSLGRCCRNVSDP